MPARKIPKNHLVVTGGHSSKKGGGMVAFESLLERDYMILLDSDPQVVKYEEQPVKIPVRAGKHYVPDILTEYMLSEYSEARFELVEVKSSEDLKKNSEKYAAKFAAAHAYANERGWTFVLKTEVDIRIPRLANLKFLRDYRWHVADKKKRLQVLTMVAELGGETTTEAILSRLSDSMDNRATWLPEIWSLLLSGDLGMDLDEPMPPNVPIWLPGCL